MISGAQQHPSSFPRRRSETSSSYASKITRRANHPIPVHPAREKISASRLTQITSLFRPSRPTEGRLAIVTDAGRDAVDAAASGTRLVFAGRVFRERSNGVRTNGASTPPPKCARQHMAGRGLVEVAAYGKTMWSWHPLLVLNRRRFTSPTGLRCTFNPPMTVARRIRRRGERGISR